MKKALLQAVFGQIKRGGIVVRYWDGDECSYGDSEPKVKLIFHKSPPLVAGIEDPILALGEYYMDEIIDYEGSFDELIRIVEMNLGTLDTKKYSGISAIGSALKEIASTVDRLVQKRNIHTHYDLGNDFFSLWLDKTLCYSCAYFKTPNDSLYDAQMQKIDLILKKLRLKPGERLLDIGCGWGGLMIQAVRQYGVKATGITLSEEQYAGVQQKIQEYGLADSIEVKLMNYLDLDETVHQFERIVSVGMFEHVGRENLPLYMNKVQSLLVPGGVSLLHTITNVVEHKTNAWIGKYIFPGGYVPSLRETIALLPECDFHLLHAESLRLHYAKTLDIWYENFCQHLEEIERKMGRRFIRMWSLYLQGCAASFRASGLDIHQLVFTKGLNNTLPFTLEDIYQ